MAFIRKLQVRFDHVDFARIVFYPRLFEYAHNVFEDFFAAQTGVPYDVWLRDRNVGFPAVHSESDFRRPFRMGEVCRVEMETVKLGETSATHRYRLYRGDETERAAELRVTTVTLDLVRYVKLPLPGPVRDAYTRHFASDGVLSGPQPE